MQALRGALGKMSGRLLLSQWVGNFLLMLLAAAWLQIPDSHTWQFAFSMLSGVLLVVGFLWLYTATFHHLRPCAEPAAAMAELALLLAVHGAVVADAAADCRRPGARRSLCRLLEFSIAAVAAPHLGYSALSPGRNVSMTVCNGCGRAAASVGDRRSAPAESTRAVYGTRQPL